MEQNVYISLQKTLEDWKMMQHTVGDEGAEWAERFERHFYEFIDELKKWVNIQTPRPKTLEDAEEMEMIKEIKTLLPTPLLLNVITELEAIIDKEEQSRFD
jgi:hypothetical protein